MANKKLVSFLIAAYNEERFIVECIESCISQSYENIEVVVVDDGSSDQTAKLVKLHFGHDIRIRYFSFSENRGKVHAYNLAFQESNGDYICLVGADDINLNQRVDVCLNELHSRSCDLVVGALDVCDANLVRVSTIKVSENWSIFDLLFSNRIPGGATFFSRSCGLEIFPIPGDLKFEDWWIAFVVATQKKSWGSIDSVVIKYRQHAANDIGVSGDAGIRRKKDWKRHESYYIQFEKYFESLNYCRNHPLRIHARGCGAIKSMYLCDSIFERLRIFSTSNFPLLIKYKIIYIFTLIFGSKGYELLIKSKGLGFFSYLRKDKK